MENGASDSQYKCGSYGLTRILITQFTHPVL